MNGAPGDRGVAPSIHRSEFVAQGLCPSPIRLDDPALLRSERRATMMAERDAGWGELEIC